MEVHQLQLLAVAEVQVYMKQEQQLNRAFWPSILDAAVLVQILLARQIVEVRQLQLPVLGAQVRLSQAQE